MLDLLAPLAGDYDDDDDEEEEIEDEEEMNGEIFAQNEVETKGTVGVATGGNGKGETETNDDDDDEYTDEEEGELLSNVFANLANGKVSKE